MLELINDETIFQPSQRPTLPGTDSDISKVLRLSDKYFSLANPVADEKNIYILSTDGNIRSINNKNFKVNWKKKLSLKSSNRFIMRIMIPRLLIK